jgi:hypothetical protein
VVCAVLQDEHVHLVGRDTDTARSLQFAQGTVFGPAQAIEVPKMREAHRQIDVLALVPQHDPRPAIGGEARLWFLKTSSAVESLEIRLCYLATSKPCAFS